MQHTFGSDGTAHAIARRARAATIPAVLAATLALVVSCGASKSTPTPTSTNAETATFCAATKTVISGLVGKGHALSPKDVPAIEKVQQALATMRGTAPASLRSDVNQITTVWSPLLADLLAGAQHPGSTPPPSFERQGNAALNVLLGAPGTAIGSWVDAHCSAGAGSGPSATPTGTAAEN